MQNATTIRQPDLGLSLTLRNAIAEQLAKSKKRIIRNADTGDTIGGAVVLGSLAIVTILAVSGEIGSVPTALLITALLCGGGTSYFARVAKRTVNYFHNPVNDLLAELERYSLQHALLEGKIAEFRAKGGRFLNSILTNNRSRWTQLATTDYAAQLAGKTRRERKLIIAEIKQVTWEIRKMGQDIVQRPLTNPDIVLWRWTHRSVA